jgi:cysteinyl-tRNA synthetase
MANLFETVPLINSLKTGQIKEDALRGNTFALLKKTWKEYLEDILGLKQEQGRQDETLNGVMQLLMDIRKEVRSKKDYATSDQIRDALQRAGITVKDEKDGSANWSVN